METLAKGGQRMILRVSSSSISPCNSGTKPGPSDDCYFVNIANVPSSVSVGQVILLFDHTARKIAEKNQFYEFEFSELCPTAVLFGR